MSDVPPVNLANDSEDTILFPLTEGSPTERPVRSPLYGPASPPWNYSPNVSQNSSKSPDYHPTSRTEDKGKRPEESGPSKKRARSPSYDDIDTKYEIMNLRRTTERSLEGLLRHVARVEVRMDEKDREVKKLKEENAILRKELASVKYEGERSARMGKQSLAYLREDVDFKIRMERNRVDNQLARRDYDNNTVNNRVSNLYDNLEYLYEKQKKKNEKVEEFMKDAEKKE